MISNDLDEKLKKLEALAQRGATEGERNAARAAIERITGKPYTDGQHIDIDIDTMTIDDLAQLQNMIHSLKPEDFAKRMNAVAEAIRRVAES